MVDQFVTVMPATLAPALMVMCLGVLLKVGEGKDRPISASWRRLGLALGLVAALIFAALRATAVINQRSAVNFPVLVSCVVVDAMIVAVVIRSHAITSQWSQHKARMTVANAVAALAIALTVFYALPDVILRLTVFVQPGDPVFTSQMLLRALGFLLGILAAVLIAAMFHTLKTPAIRPAFTIAALVLMVLMFMRHLVALLQLMQGTMLMVHGLAFRLLIWFINNNDLLIIAQAGVFAAPAIASVVAGIRMNADRMGRTSGVARPLGGPASQGGAVARSLVAWRRRSLAAAVWSVVAMTAVTLTLTVGVAAINKVPTLSPPEAYALSKSTGIATIPFRQVEDGHLHRFEYKAKDGTAMRFIIIKKNGGAYGVGLDACENCGDAGYYEKDGKIICKKCDVAINLATIGFKGGCNPIPFPYHTGGATITINTADLDALSAHFT